MATWEAFGRGPAAFFDPEWMFGLQDGFDLVIGNPPYMRVQGIQQTQGEYVPYYRAHYQSASGSFDLYALFIERGYQLLIEKGEFAYIVPHKFFQAAFGQPLRKLLTTHNALRQIVRFGSEQVFDEATTYTCLLFLSKQAQETFDLLEVRTLARGDEVLQAARKREKHPDYDQDQLPAPILPKASEVQTIDWNFVIGQEGRVLRRIQQHPRTLGDIVQKIFQGIATSADKIYVLEVLEDRGETLLCYSRHLEAKIKDGTLKNAKPKDAEIEIERGLVKPFLMGKDVHRYEPPMARNVVVFPYNIHNNKAELMSAEFIQKQFPLGWAYMEQNRHDLGERERGRMHGDNFYAYIYPKNLTEFEASKIMTPEIALGGQMTLDSQGVFYHTTKVYSFVFNPSYEHMTKFMLGLLNSKVLWFFITMTGYVLRGGYYTFKTNYLSPFPIPIGKTQTEPEKDRERTQQQVIETLVDYVLWLKAQNEPQDKKAAAQRRVITAYFEQLIDAVVYEMYFPEELADAGKRPSELLHAEQLPSLSTLPDNKLVALTSLFERLYAPTHPVRSLIHFLDSIETIRIIEEKSKRT